MTEIGIKSPNATVSTLGLGNVAAAYWNLEPALLIEESIIRGEGSLTDTGALVVDTGEFTGRSPKERFIVSDKNTEKTICWGNVNKPFDSNKFDALYNRITAYLSGKEIFVRDVYACADPAYRLNIRVVNELAWHNLFVNCLFLRPTAEEINSMVPDWHIIAAPGFCAVPEIDGTTKHNFIIINFTRKVVILGGTAYAGEMKKSIFSVLNYILPHEKGVLPMHCSATVGEKGDTAVFFGLSGTGKTTLSADPTRKLIGDDEHGWTEKTVFNFEGGCYAKCIRLSKEKEPQIYDAIKFGAVLENVNFFENSTNINYDDGTKTENTRAAYPLNHINNALTPSIGEVPKNVFFLTCDAFGVLPPISKLDKNQAMYHFISGYTAKVAGTETGVTEPQLTFSACFGGPFLPLHPAKYAEMFGEKIQKHKVNVWLINTGWSGGPYGIGKRINLPYTRTIINAAINGNLAKVEFETHPVFGLKIPKSCPGVPSEMLNPRNTWKNKDDYDVKANELAKALIKNFKTFQASVNKEIINASPKVLENVGV